MKTDTCTGLFTFASAVQSVKFIETGEHQRSVTDIFRAIENKGHKEALKCGLGAQDHALYTGYLHGTVHCIPLSLILHEAGRILSSKG